VLRYSLERLTGAEPSEPFWRIEEADSMEGPPNFSSPYGTYGESARVEPLRVLQVVGLDNRAHQQDTDGAWETTQCFDLDSSPSSY
jgi:hypothetical protein